jgi:hypothetical protein
MRPSTPLTKRGDSEHRPVDVRHPIERPTLGVAAEDLVDAGLVCGHALDQLHRVVAHRRVGQRHSVRERAAQVEAAHIGLVEDVHRTLAGLTTRGHLVALRERSSHGQDETRPR